jgi:dipeptidyl-peptidase-3
MPRPRRVDAVTQAGGPQGEGARELERLGPDGMDYLVLGIDAPGFEKLTSRQKALAYHLYRAAIAGDRIFTAQSHRCALEIQELIETIYLNSEGLDPGIRSAVHDYLKYLWINHGQYDHDHHRKFVPRLLTPEMLGAAARQAASKGADLKLGQGEDIDAKLARLRPHIFEREYEPIQTNQKEGEDILATSAVALYDPGITSQMFEALDPEWKVRLNVKFHLRDGQIVPEVYRIGGLHGRDLEAVAFFLGKAIPLAESDDQRQALQTLLGYYHSGEEGQFLLHSIHWLKSSTTVDYINGFIEQYKDPRGVIGQFEANVSFVSDSAQIGKLADSASYFEQLMPWPEIYKRRRIERPVANVVNVIVETGDAGPKSPAAYNLPNYADIRKAHGSKNVVMNNIEGARSPQVQEAMYQEFYLPKFRDNVRRHFDIGRKWTVYMHEVIGHGSGQVEPGLQEDPRNLIGRAYSALEECRADLVALYHMFDPKLVQIGAFSREDRAGVIEAAYLGYLQGHVARYRSIPEDTVREAHRRGEELVLQYLSRRGPKGDRDFGVRIVREEGKYFVDLTDVKKAREGVSELLATLQTIKSKGDEKAATEIFDRFGTRLDPDVRRDITERAERLKIPRETAFVFPRLEPVMKDGEVVDAAIYRDEDLTAQQLRFARLRFGKTIP